MCTGTSDSPARSPAIFQQHAVNPAHGYGQKSKPAAPHEKYKTGELGTYTPARQPEFPAM